MDTAQFCGLTCHNVMKPEYVSYVNSPHAHVACADCHIGPGASWFVKSKLSGVGQVFAVALNNYPRPIPVPVENLRPARETCEHCHWPARFSGDILRFTLRMRPDENNEPSSTVLLMKVGGQTWNGSAGIHGVHLEPECANCLYCHGRPPAGDSSGDLYGAGREGYSVQLKQRKSHGRGSGARRDSAPWTAWTATAVRRMSSSCRNGRWMKPSDRGRSAPVAIHQKGSGSGAAGRLSGQRNRGAGDRGLHLTGSTGPIIRRFTRATPRRSGARATRCRPFI